jgi:uncharacterized protein
VRRFDLRALRFGESSEAWRGLPVEVSPFVFGGLDYEVVGGAVDLLLTAARVGENLTLTGELEADVVGPCQRCLGEAAVHVQARGIDYVRHGESEGGEEAEEEGYATAFILDVERWVRDLIAESLPTKILCRAECRGLCPVCGADLNDDPDHRHPEARRP